MSLSDPETLAKFQNASRASRRDFLTKLSSHFNPSDWHHLHHLLTKHPSYIDILTTLPLEISLQIIQYLSPVETILLRAVSRGYYNLLTSPETCRFLFDHFFPRCDIPAGSSRIHYENIISRRLYFRRGRPTKFEKIPDSGSVTSFCTSTSTLASVIGDTLRVYLLTTSPPTLLLPPKRTSDRAHPIYCILTPVIAAVTTNNGNCQIWDLATHATHTIRLHSAPTSAIFGSGNTLIMAIGNDILIYDAAQKRTKIFERVLQGPNRRCLSLVVHEPTRRAWVIDVNYAGQTSMMALCLDTGAVVVPREIFNRGSLGMLVDAGSGVWRMGCWGFWLDGCPEAARLRAAIGHTGGTIQMQRYPKLRMALPYPRILLPPVMAAGGFIHPSDLGTDKNFVVWEDVSWACLGECITFVCDQTEGNKGVMERQLKIHAICERFFVVENGAEELGIFRFEGVHERSTEPKDDSTELWVRG